jgi:hypothetical protein
MANVSISNASYSNLNTRKYSGKLLYELHYIKGISNGDISLITGMTRIAVVQKISRYKKTLESNGGKKLC